MSETMIPVRPDVLQSLWATRRNDNENWSDIISRHLPLSREAQPKRPHIASNKLSSNGGVSYEILGETRAAPTAIDMVVDVLRTFGELDSSFLSRLEPHVRKRERNHIASRPELVYPLRPDLAHNARELLPGWYIGANIANREKLWILRAACKVAGLLFGIDLKVVSWRVSNAACGIMGGAVMLAD